MGKANAQTLANQALIGEMEKIRKATEEISKMYQDIKDIQGKSDSYVEKVEKRLIEASSKELDTSKIDEAILKFNQDLEEAVSKFNKDLKEAQSKVIKTSSFPVNVMFGALVAVFISMGFAIWQKDSAVTWQSVANGYYDVSWYLKDQYKQNGKLEEEDLKDLIKPDDYFERID